MYGPCLNGQNLPSLLSEAPHPLHTLQHIRQLEALQGPLPIKISIGKRGDTLLDRIHALEGIGHMDQPHQLRYVQVSVLLLDEGGPIAQLDEATERHVLWHHPEHQICEINGILR
jgi:hypothetical protein